MVSILLLWREGLSKFPEVLPWWSRTVHIGHLLHPWSHRFLHLQGWLSKDCFLLGAVPSLIFISLVLFVQQSHYGVSRTCVQCSVPVDTETHAS